MKLKVVTPEHVVLEEEVASVFAKASDGEVGILNNHIPMVTPLDIGILRYVHEGKKSNVAIMGGMLHTNGEEVIVLSDAAEKAEDIDELRAKSAQDRAEAFLKQTNADVDMDRAQQALARAMVRMKAKQSV